MEATCLKAADPPGAGWLPKQAVHWCQGPVCITLTDRPLHYEREQRRQSTATLPISRNFGPLRATFPPISSGPDINIYSFSLEGIHGIPRSIRFPSVEPESWQWEQHNGSSRNHTEKHFSLVGLAALKRLAKLAALRLVLAAGESKLLLPFVTMSDRA